MAIQHQSPVKMKSSITITKISKSSTANIGSILDKCDKFNLDDRAKFPSLNMTMDEIVNIYSMTNKQQNISSLKKYKILSKQVFMAIRCIFKNVHKKEEHHLQNIT